MFQHLGAAALYFVFLIFYYSVPDVTMQVDFGISSNDLQIVT